MDEIGLFQGLPHRHPGIERGIGVLKNDLHPPPQLLEPAVGQAGQVFAGEPHLPTGGRQQGQEHAAQGGFAAAGLPHQPQGFPFLQGQVHLLHSLEGRPPAPGPGQAKVAAQILSGDQGLGHG
ncbi:MAG: hypothetical protein R6V67_01100 [Spirochaetia bacterium]